MRKDDDIFVMGEDIAEMGGSMGVTQGMLDEFGPERVRNTPISEMALVGAGIGAVLALLFAPKSGEELRNDIADATRKGIDRSKEAAEQLGAKATEYYDATRARAGEVYDTARETAGEYYEATRERATELYDTATTKAGEVASAARTAAVRQASSVQAAVEAGKKAYVEEKRKTELSGRTEASPTYKPEKAM